MQSVVRTFSSPLDAGRAVRALEAAGVPRPRLLVLAPHTPARELARRVPSESGESAGMGAALGAVVGGSVGLSAAALVLPGVGPVVAMGILVAGILGATGGGLAGETLEAHLTRGVPGQDLEEARQALRDGRTVVIVLAETPHEADTARDTLDAAVD